MKKLSDCSMIESFDRYLKNSTARFKVGSNS